MKNKFIYIICFILVVTGCEDFLDLKPISSTTSENAYKTASDAEAALIGTYDSFSQTYYVWDFLCASDIMSDNFYSGGDNLEINAFEDLTVGINNSRIYGWWGSLYNAILKANTVLAKVPAIEDAALDEDNRRNQILGEASFLRAYHYYHLVKLFGGVPLITEPSSSTDPEATQVPRNTEAEVYAQIIEDLEYAAANLPDTYGDDASVNKGRATKGAANAMLAKVYAQKSDRDYQKVLEYCNEVISSSAGYILLDEFDDLWDGDHYNNNESIMEVQFGGEGDKDGNWGPQMNLPPSISGDTWRKFATPSHNLIDAYDAEGDDIRKNATIFFENVNWVDEYWSPTTGGSVPFAYRWREAGGWNSSNRQYIVRLGDIILLKAEALNELDRLEEARVEINRIRDRAGLGDTPAATKEEMKTAILNERRLELAQEGQRWDDLKRAGVAVETMNNLVEINLLTGMAKDYPMEDYMLLLPIPQSERDRNPNLEPNPGYN